MSEGQKLEGILAKAREEERRYDWLAAAHTYGGALDLLNEKNLSERCQILESSCYAQYRAAFQAKSADEFRSRAQQAVEAYGDAKEQYARLGEPRYSAMRLRCEAMIAYLSSWLSGNALERKRLLDASWGLVKQALQLFEGAGEVLEYARTYNDLSPSAELSCRLDSTPANIERTLRELVEYGEKAVKLLSHGDNRYEFARACVKLLNYDWYHVHNYLPAEEQELRYRKERELWTEARERSPETSSLESVNAFMPSEAVWAGGTQEELSNFRKALEITEKTRDNLLIGLANDHLAYHTFWRGVTTEDPGERAELSKQELQYAEQARYHYSIMSFLSPNANALWVEAPDAEHYWWLARIEPELGRKRELLQTALKAAPELLRRAENSGYPETHSYAAHVYSKILASLAPLEGDSQSRRRHLEEALTLRQETISFDEKHHPFQYWNHGVHRNYLANIKAELANLAEEHEERTELLRDAIQEKERSLKIANTYASIQAEVGQLANLAWIATRRYELGEMLLSLYQETGDREDLKRAAESYEETAESFQKLDLQSRLAECYWKSAQIHDSLSEHDEAAREFLAASEAYNLAAQEIPQLTAFYHDHAAYMQAWSEIENARYHHSRQNYREAAEHYEAAASLHKSTDHWNYLTANYSAWGHIEHAEDLSRKEQGQEAIQAFKEAARLFLEFKKAIQAEQSKIESSEERQVASEIAGVTDLRYEYSQARILLEEAKILDKKGEHSAGSEKYGSASETLEKIMASLKSQQDQREIKLVMILSKAWQSMARSEAEVLPELYLEAASLFEQAKELSPNETSKMLAAGHSRFCKALEAGTRFSDTGEETQHATATQNLESAARYYLKAGFKHASEYTNASKLLFDAYAYMNSANKESDQEKRARFFLLAEKMLQASAQSYMAAEQLGKKKEVLKLLEKVKKEKDLAVSLTEVLRAPTFLSTAAAFTTPTSTHEKAVGLERFEHADIQASMIIPRKHLKVGEDLDLEIELVNAGRGAAQIIKIEELIPEGFELTTKPEAYRVEDAYLNMKGRRLDALKTVEVKLILKPKLQGRFTLKPRILYLDEDGKYKSHEPEPVEISVKELGISGWIKGTKA